MSRRARHLSLYLAALAAGVVAAFAVSAAANGGGAPPPPAASVTAKDNYWEVNGAPASTATIAAGGSVTFSYPAGSDDHNAHFTVSQPSSCTPALPAMPAPPGWSAACSFVTPGSYPFICERHPSSMKGTVEVLDPAGTPPTTPPPQTGPGTTPPGSTTPGGSPTQPTAPSFKIARRQRGNVLRGSVTTPVAGSRIVITAFVSNRALVKRPRRTKKVPVGSQRKSSTTAGRTRFALKLNAVARGALARRGRLAVELRIVVTPPGGRATRTTVAVKLRPA